MSTYQWHAKVHKSGSKVAVFNGTNLVKVVDASKETFEPAEAQKFAEQLVKELHDRSASQMTDGNQAPSVTTTAEEQQVSLSAVNQQATGKGAGDSKPTAVEEKADECSDENSDVEEKFASENQNLRQIISNLKKKLFQEREERNVERKARRGLAIAKQMVVEGSLEDSYDSIKSKVAMIVKLEDSEIDRIEKKVAGEQEFDSIDEASKEIRRQARIARINRQAAAEAQEDGDESQADQLDKKADEAEAKTSHIQQILDSMKKKAEAKETPAEEKKEETTETPAEEKKEEKSDVPVVVEEKKEEATETPAEEKKEEKADAEKCEEQCKASDESTEKLAAKPTGNIDRDTLREVEEIGKMLDRFDVFEGDKEALKEIRDDATEIGKMIDRFVIDDGLINPSSEIKKMWKQLTTNWFKIHDFLQSSKAELKPTQQIMNALKQVKTDWSKIEKFLSSLKKSSTESTEKLAAMARKYRKIAADHRKLAESAESNGDIEAADKQDELADAAEINAEEIEKKLSNHDEKTAESAETQTAEQENTDDDDDNDADDAPVVEEEVKKETSRKAPGTTVTSSKHKPLVREGEAVEESFGIDKNASLVEQNDFSNDPEVELLSKMWRGSGKDDE